MDLFKAVLVIIPSFSILGHKKFKEKRRNNVSGALPGIFEGRGGSWKLGHKSMAVLKFKVKCKH